MKRTKKCVIVALILVLATSIASCGTQPQKDGEQTTNQTIEYKTYNDVEYYMETVNLDESFKIAGVKYSDFPNFANIDEYKNNYKPLMMEKHTPYTEINIGGTMVNSGDYIFGCQVDSLDDLPEGMVGFDTGISNFACITFKADTVYDLVGGADGPGKAMQAALEYIKKVWLPENMDKVFEVDMSNEMFMKIKIDDKDYNLFDLIEVYKTDINEQPEMSYYIPLKD